MTCAETESKSSRARGAREKQTTDLSNYSFILRDERIDNEREYQPGQTAGAQTFS
jgi:hypothetical protein